MRTISDQILRLWTPPHQGGGGQERRMHMSRSPKEAKASPNKAGRPRGRVPRPPIQIDGDVLIPKTEAAQQLGVAP
jgi:hypothetical protein